MSSNRSAAKRYIRSVSHMLSCSGNAKRMIISQIRNSVANYLIQNPDADFEMIQMHFGAPQEIAASYVNEQDAAGLLKRISIKKKVLLIVSGVMVVILLLWMGSVAWATIDSKKSQQGNVEMIAGEK